MHASSSLILNATKHLAGLPDNMYLLPENIIDSVTHLKKDILNGKMVSLDVDETLIVLGISALSNPAAKMALENLKGLRGCEVHLTHIPTPGDEAGWRKLKVTLHAILNIQARACLWADEFCYLSDAPFRSISMTPPAALVP